MTNVRIRLNGVEMIDETIINPAKMARPSA